MSSPVPATNTYGHRLYVGYVGIHILLCYICWYLKSKTCSPLRKAFNAVIVFFFVCLLFFFCNKYGQLTHCKHSIGKLFKHQNTIRCISFSSLDMVLVSIRQVLVASRLDNKLPNSPLTHKHTRCALRPLVFVSVTGCLHSDLSFKSC